MIKKKKRAMEQNSNITSMSLIILLQKHACLYFIAQVVPHFFFKAILRFSVVESTFIENNHSPPV